MWLYKVDALVGGDAAMIPQCREFEPPPPSPLFSILNQIFQYTAH